MTPATPDPSSRRRSRWRLAVQALITIAVGVTLGGCPPPVPPPANPNLLCFPQATGVPNFGGPPTIDGRLSGPTPSPEFGWTGSMRYTFGNGTQTPNAAVQALRDANNVYLSFEVNFASTPDTKDGILLVFSPTKNDPTNDRRIFIAPFQNNVAPPANTPQSVTSVQYWVDSTLDTTGPNMGNSKWNDPGQAAGQAAVNPAFLFNNIQVQHDVSNTWYLEMKIPIAGGPTNGIANKGNDTGINFPATGDFGFYFDILDHPGAYVERTFPDATGLTPSMAIASPSTNTPLPAAWGRGSLSGIACNGVSFVWWDIKIEHPQSVNAVPDDIISLNQSNRFTVSVWNASVNANNQYIPALDVDATFKIANFGLPALGDYADIPVGAHTAVNATVPVPPNNTTQGNAVLASSPDWTLNATQQGQYGADTHQCILVVLDSNATNPTTILLNKSVVRNMDFAQTASPFRRTISLSGGPDRNQESDFLLFTRTSNTPPGSKWTVDLQGAQPVAGTPGLYSLRVKGGTSVPIGTVTEPPPVVIPSQDIRLPPNAGADGRGVPIRVKAGELITLIVDGSIQVRRDKALRAGADGASIETRPDYQQQYLLPAGFAPGTRVGAVIAAWDGDFKGKPVIIGSAQTLKVPNGATNLVLAINDTPAGFAEHTGEGFHLQVIETPLEPYYAVTDTSILRDPSAERLRISLGANLPTMVTCGYRKTGRKISVNGFVDDLIQETACFGYGFNKIGLR